MGRRTLESLPCPLDKRTTVIVTRNAATKRMPHVAPGVAQVIDLGRRLDPRATIWIAGGAGVYRDALPTADRMELTEIDAQAPADAFFPDFSGAAFTAYMWLSLKWPDVYADHAGAVAARSRCNALIEEALKQNAIRRTCSQCGTRLAPSHVFPICDACHQRQYRRFDEEFDGPSSFIGRPTSE